MSKSTRADLGAPEIAALAKGANLRLAPDRPAHLVEPLRGIFQLLDRLDDVVLGETAPASRYDARASASAPKVHRDG
ncbi:MAG: hypothetical protein AAFX81_03455 [Pseudomonadota bacterium]